MMPVFWPQSVEHTDQSDRKADTDRTRARIHVATYGLRQNGYITVGASGMPSGSSSSTTTTRSMAFESIGSTGQYNLKTPPCNNSRVWQPREGCT